MEKRKGPIRIAIQVVVFVALFYGMASVLDYVLGWLAGDLAGRTFAVLCATLLASWLTLRIFEGIPVREVGLWWSRDSMDNLGLGLAGGAGAACLALTPPLLTGAARIVCNRSPDYSTFVFALICVAAGSIGEELLFHGYGFQLLMASLGPWATILPVGVIFGWMHAANPGASTMGLIDTAGFGILFGYAYLRSRDLWLPIGLHVGWNVLLPLFGADLSGFRIFREASGYELVWRAGALWSGGNYGPEASLLTSAALIPLFVYLWKAPIRRQFSPLTDRPAEDPPCEPAPQSES
ncbi:MAG: CPBP family intramembrane glutamic endopeptidase [Bryobacteraceae bacterium]